MLVFFIHFQSYMSDLLSCFGTVMVESQGLAKRRDTSLAVYLMVPPSPRQELESINEDVQAMSSCCQDMTSRLQVLCSGLVSPLSPTQSGLSETVTWADGV